MRLRSEFAGKISLHFALLIVAKQRSVELAKYRGDTVKHRTVKEGRELAPSITFLLGTAPSCAPMS